MSESPPLQTTLRAATPEDASQIAQLKVRCWRHAYQGLMPQTELDRLNADEETPHWRSWLSENGSGLIALLLEREGQLLGYGLAGPMRKGDRAGEEIEAEAEIYALYVHPDHQREGHGQRLFAALVAALLEAGNLSMGLWMMGGNKLAEAFYGKMLGIEHGKRVEIRDGRIAFREKGWRWDDLKQLHARLTVRAI